MYVFLLLKYINIFSNIYLIQFWVYLTNSGLFE